MVDVYGQISLPVHVTDAADAPDAADALILLMLLNQDQDQLMDLLKQFATVKPPVTAISLTCIITSVCPPVRSPK